MSKFALVFDLDGTLIDSIPDVRAALNRALLKLQLQQLTLAQVKTMVGHGAHYMIRSALTAAGGEDSETMLNTLLEVYLNEYRERPVEHTILYPNVPAVLQQLYEQGFNLGICTNKPYAMSLLVLEQLQLLQLFTAVTGGDHLPFCKPDARHIEETLRLMRAEEASAIMIGDGNTDIEAASNAGIPSILVTYGYHEHDDLVADARINDFAQLPDAIAKINREMRVDD